MEIIFEPQTAHLTIISVNDCRSDPDGCLCEHKTPAAFRVCECTGSVDCVFIPMCVHICMCEKERFEGKKNPLQSVVNVTAPQWHRRGEREGWPRIRILSSRFVPPFRGNRATRSVAPFFRRASHCLRLNGRTQGQNAS